MASTNKKADPYKVDEDNPEWTEADFAKARPASEVFRELGLPVPPKPRGRPPVENPKMRVTMRLDPDVVDALKKRGKGWQTRANELLRQALHLPD
jgi:uncharacterized protein (DUF4415 family)